MKAWPVLSGIRMAEHYLAWRFGSASRELRHYRKSMSRQAQRGRRLNQTYAALEQLYGSAEKEATKRERKATLFARLQQDLGHNAPLNNAALLGFRTYGLGRPEFDRLLKQCAQDWRLFLRVLSEVEEGDFDKEQEDSFGTVLEGLSARARRSLCPGTRSLKAGTKPGAQEP